MPEIDIGEDKKYKVKTIADSFIYARSARGYLLKLYYLLSWKSYFEDKSTQQPPTVVMYTQKMINTFQINHSEKSTAMFLPLEIILLYFLSLNS